MERRRGSPVVVEDPFDLDLVRAVLEKRGYSIIVAEPRQVMELLRRPKPCNGTLVTNSPAAFGEFAE
jgi:hypothetical protein